MESTMMGPVARFHRALVEEILRSRPSYLSEPFTVAEIYQNLVPYRTHRDRIGVEMNGDYEDALLRLLAGEGEYLVLESEHAVREIRDELGSSNPNTGLYRAYAAADVRLNPLLMPRDLPDPVRGPAVGQAAAPVLTVMTGGLDAILSTAEDPFPRQGRVVMHESGLTATPIQPSAGPQAAASEPPARPATPGATPKASVSQTPPKTSSSQPAKPAQPKGSASTPTPARGGPPSACVWCREPLPDREKLNFCPFCGADMHTAPCSNCGEELEVEWWFCVACGTSVGERG